MFIVAFFRHQLSNYIFHYANLGINLYTCNIISMSSRLYRSMNLSHLKENKTQYTHAIISTKIRIQSACHELKPAGRWTSKNDVLRILIWCYMMWCSVTRGVVRVREQENRDREDLDQEAWWWSVCSDMWCAGWGSGPAVGRLGPACQDLVGSKNFDKK